MNSRKKKLAAAAMLFASVFGAKKSEALNPQVNTQISKKNNLTVAPPTRKFNKDLLLKIGIPSVAAFLITGGILTWALWPKNKDAKKANPIPADTDTTSKVLGATTSDVEINGKKAQAAPKLDQNKQKNIVPNVNAEDCVKSFLQKKIQDKDFLGLDCTYFKNIEELSFEPDEKSFSSAVDNKISNLDDVANEIVDKIYDKYCNNVDEHNKNVNSEKKINGKLDRQSIRKIVDNDIKSARDANELGINVQVSNLSLDCLNKAMKNPNGGRDPKDELKQVLNEIAALNKMKNDTVVGIILNKYNDFIEKLSEISKNIEPGRITLNKVYDDSVGIEFSFKFNKKDNCKYVMIKTKNKTYAEVYGRIVK